MWISESYWLIDFGAYLFIMDFWLNERVKIQCASHWLVDFLTDALIDWGPNEGGGESVKTDGVKWVCGKLVV